MTAKVLVVDDDAAIRYTLRGILEDEGLAVEEAPGGAEALSRCETEEFDLVITDLRMPGVGGMEVLTRLGGAESGPKVIMITAHGSERQAVEAMKAGAYDYFKKPFEVDALVAVVQRAVDAVRLRQEKTQLEGELNLSRSMVFVSQAMRRLASLVQRVGPRDVTVLITGESGTGKERVAEAIVRVSGRSERPFVRFNCASLSATLAEAELFGHTKGAFTGAERARPGLFREADGGTLLLDEIGELDIALQAKLLRIVQSGEVRAVGAEKVDHVDVRLIAATHRDLRELADAGEFREDLFFRLNVVNLQIPPLRERPEDIPGLARHFLDQYARRFGVSALQVPDDLIGRLTTFAWRGNVRELENTIEGLVALSDEGALDLSILPDDAAPAQQAAASLTLKQRLGAYERGIIVAALDACHGSRTEAARHLGISRVTLHDKLKKYRLTDEA